MPYSLQEINYRPAPTERTPILPRSQAEAHPRRHGRPISLVDALFIPGVVEFSLCLFFTKLVSYTFMYWLPLYIQKSSNYPEKPRTAAIKLTWIYDITIFLQALWVLHCLLICPLFSMWAVFWEL